jgi:hypothetical protein
LISWNSLSDAPPLLSLTFPVLAAYLSRICRTFPAFPVKQKEQAYSLLFFKKKSPDQ